MNQAERDFRADKAKTDMQMHKDSVFWTRIDKAVNFLGSIARGAAKQIFGHLQKKNRTLLGYCLVFMEGAQDDPDHATAEEPYNAVTFPFISNTILKGPEKDLQELIEQAMQTWVNRHFGEIDSEFKAEGRFRND